MVHNHKHLNIVKLEGKSFLMIAITDTEFKFEVKET